MFTIRNFIDSLCFFLLSTDVIWRIQHICVDVEWWWREMSKPLRKKKGGINALKNMEEDWDNEQLYN